MQKLVLDEEVPFDIKEMAYQSLLGGTVGGLFGVANVGTEALRNRIENAKQAQTIGADTQTAPNIPTTPPQSPQANMNAETVQDVSSSRTAQSGGTEADTAGGKRVTRQDLDRAYDNRETAEEVYTEYREMLDDKYGDRGAVYNTLENGKGKKSKFPNLRLLNTIGLKRNLKRRYQEYHATSDAFGSQPQEQVEQPSKHIRHTPTVNAG